MVVNYIYIYVLPACLIGGMPFVLTDDAASHLVAEYQRLAQEAQAAVRELQGGRNHIGTGRIAVPQCCFLVIFVMTSK